MGLADQKQKRQTGDYIQSEPGFAVNGWQRSATWRGRVGARLLSQIPKPSSRLHQSVVERGELGCGGAALRKIGRGKICVVEAPAHGPQNCGRDGARPSINGISQRELSQAPSRLSVPGNRTPGAGILRKQP